jgi:histidinol phosphatase-like enzyme (inositol monophosphatase family)
MRPAERVEDRLPEYLKFARELAIEAGKIALKHFRAGLTVECKTDGTPVTSADREVEWYIRAAINERYPYHGVLGEESGETNPAAPWRWIVDPIDGTQAFIHGVPLYTTLIALEHEGRSVLGVIHCPPLGETVAAAAGCGCFFDERPCRVSEVAELAQARVNVTDCAAFMKRAPKFATSLLRSARMCRGWGDGFGYLLLATGRAEVSIDCGVSLWDCAPLKPIVEEAGGVYGDFAGAPLTSTGTVLASNGLLHRQLLSLASLDTVGRNDDARGCGVVGGGGGQGCA